MISFKGILKYSIYLFIAGWMFFLGIMVGRGNSPVTFDTRKFQERLETIAGEFGKNKEQREKVELKFYDALEKPVPEEEVVTQKTSGEIVPGRVDDGPADAAVKTSLKKQTYDKAAAAAVLAEKKEKASAPAKKTAVKKDTVKKEKAAAPAPGKYTLQVAAYKDFKDAVTRMAQLEKKGFKSYRVRAEKDGVTWYRVRTGSFAAYDEARAYKEKLKKAKIDSIILKKADNENN